MVNLAPVPYIRSRFIRIDASDAERIVRRAEEVRSEDFRNRLLGQQPEAQGGICLTHDHVAVDRSDRATRLRVLPVGSEDHPPSACDVGRFTKAGGKKGSRQSQRSKSQMASRHVETT